MKSFCHKKLRLYPPLPQDNDVIFAATKMSRLETQSVIPLFTWLKFNTLVALLCKSSACNISITLSLRHKSELIAVRLIFRLQQHNMVKMYREWLNAHIVRLIEITVINLSWKYHLQCSSKIKQFNKLWNTVKETICWEDFSHAWSVNHFTPHSAGNERFKKKLMQPQ